MQSLLSRWLLLVVFSLLFPVTAGLAQDIDEIAANAPNEAALASGSPTLIPDLDLPLTAAQVLASLTTEIQAQGITGTGPFDTLMTILRRWMQEFGPATPSGNAPGSLASNTTPVATGTSAASGTATASGTSGTIADENALAEEGKKCLEELKALGAKPGMGVADSPAKRAIAGFPDWFCDLQSILLSRQTWGDLEARSRKVLRDYATQWAKANLPQPTFHSLPFFFSYLGSCETNDAAIAKYDKTSPRSGHMGGVKDSENWCAAASNYAFMQPMMNAGFRFTNNFAWANSTKNIPQLGRGHPKFSLAPGDYISNGTHVMTVVQVRGDKTLVISGNAGGGAVNYAGTVRMEEINTSSIQVVKKHSEFTIENLQAHSDDDAWLKSHGISKK